MEENVAILQIFKKNIKSLSSWYHIDIIHVFTHTSRLLLPFSWNQMTNELLNSVWLTNELLNSVWFI